VDKKEKKDKKEKPKPGREVGTRDDQIGFKQVRLVDPETGELTPLQPLSSILQRLLSDKEVRKRHSVQLVANDPEPIVRLVNMAEQYRKTKEQKQKARQTARFSGEKEIQLTWDTAGPDHQRKLDQARESLAEGVRVNLVHAPKKGVRHRLTVREMEERAQGTVDALADVGKERKEKEVGPRITAIYLVPLQIQNLTEKEVLIPFGAASNILQRRVSEVQKELEAGIRVKVTFAEERKPKKENGQKNGQDGDSAEGTLWSGGLVKLISKELSQQPNEAEKWTRKRKDTFVDSVVAKLVGNEAKEWKPRDVWKASTTIYLTKLEPSSD